MQFKCEFPVNTNSHLSVADAFPKDKTDVVEGFAEEKQENCNAVEEGSVTKEYGDGPEPKISTPNGKP